MLPDWSAADWVWAVIAAFGIGVSKSGLPGVSLVHVVLMARLFPGQASTGVVLPMLVLGDFGAVAVYRRQADGKHLLRTLPPAVAGVALGWWVMRRWRTVDFNPCIGWVVLVLALLQAARDLRPRWFERAPHRPAFAWAMGLTAGLTTMVANAAGPVMGLYLLAARLPKAVFVGTGAWFFLMINLIKVPFSLQLGLIHGRTLALNLVLAPVIFVGLWIGRSVVSRLPQRPFEVLVLLFAVVAALRLARAI